jgi:PKD repeat protein
VPYGYSIDSISILDTYKYWVFGPKKYEVYYYKPNTYNSQTSPILIYLHGTGGSGQSSSVLEDIADRQNALIVAPSFPSDWGDNYQYAQIDYIENNCYYFTWLPVFIKQIYQDILSKENRTFIPTYLTGFSAGGQSVARYMLVRQALRDSIPIQMAVSVNPYSYTFCTDTFLGTEMPYPCGIKQINCGWYDCFSTYSYEPLLDFTCNSHVKQYYNENYAVMIGTADTSYSTSWCWTAQGSNRYERALNFYAFSDSNAVNRGTQLQWQYAEVPNVAHDAYAMYNTKASPTDTISIFEQVMFHTPYHTVPDFTPIADFSFMSSQRQVQVTDLSLNADIAFWDFGDGYTTYSNQTNVLHEYTNYGTYTICQAVGDSCISDTICKTITLTPVGIIESENAKEYFYVAPNPVIGVSELHFKLPQTDRISIVLQNSLGQKVKDLYTGLVLSGVSNIGKLDMENFKQGVYFVVLRSPENTQTIKIVK